MPLPAQPRVKRRTHRNDLHIAALLIYPVKACQGVYLDEAQLTEHGTLAYDREWCVVDASGNRHPRMQSLSQRNLPALATIRVDIDVARGRLTLNAPNMPPLGVSVAAVAKSEKRQEQQLEVECGASSTTSAGAWHLGVMASEDAGEVASKWLTRYLNAADEPGKLTKSPAVYRLVRAAAVRSLSRYAGPTQVPFTTDVTKQRAGTGSPFKMETIPVLPSDGFLFHDVAPLHLASIASFADLKNKMAKIKPTPKQDELTSYQVTCFRPNIIVTGGSPWEEEGWAVFGLGTSLTFRRLKGCPRCTVPARNQSTGKFHFSSGPFLAPQKTMRQFWPEKCIDKQWEEEWQGPVFGVHVGLTPPKTCEAP